MTVLCPSLTVGAEVVTVSRLGTRPPVARTGWVLEKRTRRETHGLYIGNVLTSFRGNVVVVLTGTNPTKLMQPLGNLVRLNVCKANRRSYVLG